MNDADIEQEIQVKKLTAPRITSEYLENLIVGEYYFTADKATNGCLQFPSLALLTFCILVLQSGFTVVGQSACVSAENFDAELGCKIARRNALDKLWELEGYALRERLDRAKE